MPVRSLSSSVLKWPDQQTVQRALFGWARKVGNRADVARIGYAGSYARGDWGVGSDLDIVVVLRDTQLPFERRATEWDATDLPVPADVLVYTAREWAALEAEGRRLVKETRWIETRDVRSVRISS